MNTPNPLIPQGALNGLDKNKANVRVAVLTILAIHIIALGGFLIQGCKPSHEEMAATDESSIDEFPPLPTGFGASNASVHTTSNAAYMDSFPNPDGTGVASDPVSVNEILTNLQQELPDIPDRPILDDEETNNVAGIYHSTTPRNASMPPSTPVRSESAVVPMIEHTVLKGETIWGLARKYKVGMRDINDANPSVDPDNLKVGQKLVIPKAASSAPTQTASTLATPPAATASDKVYVVKRGDNLTQIAKKHGTTVASLRQLNNLSGDIIKPGQKLNLPE